MDPFSAQLAADRRARLERDAAAARLAAEAKTRNRFNDPAQPHPAKLLWAKMVAMGMLHRERPEDVDVASCLANLARLDALNATGLMDAPSREDLDGLTRRAAMQLGTPMAFINLVDDRRVFYAGAYGAPPLESEARETPVEASYCQYVVAFDDVFVVDDALEDGLVADNLGTVEGGVRAYLGVPLKSGGACLGSFCVVDNEPHDWTDEDLATLETLAAQALKQLST